MSECRKLGYCQNETRLDNRVIYLRTAAKQAIFTVSLGVYQLFMEYLSNNDLFKWI